MIVPVLRFTLVSLLGCGVAWPLATTLLAGALFPHAATGSLVVHEGRVVGSALVSQPFSDPKYVRPRPSACGHDPRAAAGSNLAASNPALRERVRASSEATVAAEGTAPTAIPPELLAASGSGLDPHLTPEAVAVQVPRIAAARGRSVEEIERIVAKAVEVGPFGFGTPRVNVLLLNLALDSHAAPVPGAP